MSDRTPMTDDRITRRRLITGSASAVAIGLSGCVAEAPTASEDDDTEEDGGDEPLVARDVTAEIPAELPTDPGEVDLVDLTGYDVVVVDTREGDDGEPEYVFDPPFALVDPGTVIRWVNTDDAFHTVTSTPDLEERTGGGETFDVEIDEEGDEFEWTAADPGWQHYYCLPHTGFMWGSIAIAEDGEVPAIGDTEEEPDEADPDDPEGDPDDEDETDDEEDADEEEPEEDDEGDEIDEEDRLPEELPTDPDGAEFVDRTGEDVVEIETRQGAEGEPNFVFDPPFVRVDQGTTVRWVNGDGVFHTITSTPTLDRRSGGGEEFNAQITAVGDTFEWEADDTGRQDYYCSPHAGFMFGSIDVV